jgi:predicted dehydrogenase
MSHSAVRLGVVGCGDVAFRTYLPGLEQLRQEVTVSAFCDARLASAERAAAFSTAWSSAAAVFADTTEMLADAEVDAVLNLTPPALHSEVTAAALEAGLHVYSEKPVALSAEQGRELAASAAARGRVLLCAPGVMATNRFRWLRRVVDSGRLGRPTLATGQMTGMGPAAWRDYTGDSAAFYAAGGGPLLDTGIYLLHAITGLMGSVKRVQAFGGVAIPERTVLARSLTGHRLEVVANDHMLVQLDFGGNAFAQILSSFAVPRSSAPTMELHCTKGSATIDDFYNANAAIDFYLFDESPLGLGGALRGVRPPTKSPVDNLIVAGIAHFLACLRGEEQPLLTVEQANHVVDIMVKAEESARGGGTLSLGTSF